MQKHIVMLIPLIYVNTLSFGGGITADMIATRFDSATRNVVLDLGNGDSIAIGNAEQSVVQSLQFEDGSTLSISELFVQHPLEIRMRRHAVFINSKSANDETTQAWRIAA